MVHENDKRREMGTDDEVCQPNSFTFRHIKFISKLEQTLTPR